MKLSLILVICWMLPGLTGTAQNTQSLKLLDLQRTKLELDARKSGYERALQLQADNLISQQDFILARTEYLKAQVGFQEALIRFVGDEVRVAVESALKFQTGSGEKMVRVTVRYSAREIKELSRLGLAAEELFPLDFLKELKDVGVSLQEAGRIVSDPYEIRIPVLGIDQPAEVTFRLLKDVEAVDVNFRYAGRNEATAVYLQKGVSANSVTITSAQFSQEADLEGTATFDLSLEKFSGEADTFRLELWNLPESVNAEFIDQQTQARLSQIKFTPGTTTMRLGLRLHLPKNPDRQLLLDQPLTFCTLVLDEAQLARFRELQARPGAQSPDALAPFRAGMVSLELIPRGRGRLDLQALNLYREAFRGEPVKVEVKVRNNGTRRLNNVQPALDLPMNWHCRIEPALIPSLNQDQEAVVAITFLPPADVMPGDYEPRLKATSLTGGVTVEAEEKVFRIHLQEKTDLLAIGLLAGGVILLLVILVVVAIRLTRR